MAVGSKGGANVFTTDCLRRVVELLVKSNMLIYERQSTIHSEM
jgi:hypothetical protein